MKICVISLFDYRFVDLAKITIPNKKEYCAKHGYDFVCKTEGFTMGLGFEKIKMFKEAIDTKQYDWIYWCGCDTVITNFGITVESLTDSNYGLVIATDSHGINSDSMLVKSDEKSITFLDDVLSLYDKYNRPGQCEEEQDAVKELVNDKYSYFVKYLPQRMMNSYHYDFYVHMEEYSKRQDRFGNVGEWQSGDFIIHFPGIYYTTKLSMCMDYVNKVIGR